MPRVSRCTSARRHVGIALLSCVVAVVSVSPASADPVIAAAGDIACDPLDKDFNGGNGATNNDCRQKYTSDLLLDAAGAPTVDRVLTLGDNQYYCGGIGAWDQSYGLSWGRPALKGITDPVPGNHEYLTTGTSTPTTGCDATNTGAAGYFNYFGTSFGTAGDPSRGYYSYDLGSWHMIALNSSCTGAGGCSATSPQGKFLRADLAAHTNDCTLAYWHIPLFSSGGRASATYKTFWDALYQYGADVVLNGHDHDYERFAPQTPAGARDDQFGIREWIVGTGGANHTSFVTLAANSEVRTSTVYGVLQLTLSPNGYSWDFVPERRDAGRFADSGSASCHGINDTTPPTAPGNLTANPTGPDRINLSWTASSDDIAVAEYRIFRDGATAPIGTSTTTSFADTTVAPSTTYSYTVKAYDRAGNASLDSNTATGTTPDVGGGGGVLTFIPTDDATIKATSPTSNFGTATALQDDADPVEQFLMEFNVTGIGSRAVTAVKLRVFCTNGSGGAVSAQFYPATSSDWSQASVTWDTAPAAGATSLASLGKIAAGTWYELDLTAAGLITGDGAYTLRVASAATDGSFFSSLEGPAGFAPQLTIATG